MLNDLPPLSWLRAFEAAARHLSFTDAGAELNLTQAAVSKQVKSLELHLRHELFIRKVRGLSLTRTGEAYLPKVRDAFERLAIGTREVFGKRKSKALTIRCAVSLATSWLAPRLPAFLDEYPGVNIRLISSVWNDALERDLIDLDIQYGTGSWRGFRSHRLTWEKIMPLCTPKIAATLNNASDLAKQRLIHVIGYQEGWGTWLKSAGVASIDPGQGLHVDTSLAALEIAAHSGGIALGRRSLGGQHRESGRLVAPFDLEVPVEEAFYLLEPAGQKPHPDSALFIDWLTSSR